MLPKTIKSRLVLLITSFGVAVTIFNLWFLWGLTKWVEDFIFESLLRQEYARLEATGAFHGNADHPQVGPFHAHDSIAAFPPEWQDWLKDLDEGIHELESATSLMAMVGRGPDDSRRYLVVQTDDLEYAESNTATVWGFSALVLFITLTAAVILSLYFVRRIIDPLNRFTREVTLHDPSQPVRPIAGHFETDEIGSLARSFDELQQRLNDYIGRERRFTADVSHELRTPLAVSANAIELISERYQGKEDQRVIERLNRSVKRMQSLVEAFLALARQENSDSEAAGSVDLESLIQEAIDFHQFAYPHYNPTVIRDYPAEFSLIGSPVLLGILFRNLIVNAILYSPDNTLLVSAKGRYIRLRNRVGEGEGSGGAGIGLSIAERVAASLDLRLEANRINGHFEAVIILPRASWNEVEENDKQTNR